MNIGGINNGFETDSFDWNANSTIADFNRPRPRQNQYNNAYGDYRGGYRQDNGFGSGFGQARQPLPPPPPPPNFPGVSFGDLGFGGPTSDMFQSGPPLGPPPSFGQQQYIHGRNIQGVTGEEKSIRFLMRCGLPRDTVRALPREVLEMIEPTHCGLCDLNFDSFTMSKLHYLSKNHAKNQRKFLSQKPELNQIRSREVPFKSRDLYCELCDVHITSKQHADSHYAGKPHRSIVDGRKGPKNPVLLQPGMEERVESLIRREKKHFKSEPEKVEETPKDAKPVSPDLYCEICKTSVTCSEQMTMHLNGKKHLSKEKQHILKMMKGNASKSETDDINTEAEEGQEEDENEGEEIPENAEEATGNDWDGKGAEWE